MKRTLLILLFAGVAAISIPLLVAQAQQDGLHAPSGGTRLMMQSIYIPPLPNVPFTATVNTNWVRSLEDGSTVTLQNHRTIARDSLGRIYQERRFLLPEGDARQNLINQIEISDPRTHVLYTCQPDSHTCQVRNYFAGTRQVPAVPAGPLRNGSGVLTRETLGENTVSGVPAVGTRETTTLNAGAIGSDRAIAIVKEFWYSPLLGINLIEKRQDPRFGTQSFDVDDIRLGEPDARLFAVPADFSVRDLRAGRGGLNGN